MGDADLDAIRQRRMAEMMAAQGGGMPGGSGMTAEQQEEQEEKRRAADEQRAAMLVAVMTPDARARLSRIALVKPDKARAVENMVLAAAQRGALQQKVSEDQLVGMLETISQKESSSKPKITIQRRRPAFDDDD